MIKYKKNKILIGPENSRLLTRVMSKAKLKHDNKMISFISELTPNRRDDEYVNRYKKELIDYLKETN